MCPLPPTIPPDKLLLSNVPTNIYIVEVVIVLLYLKVVGDWTAWSRVLVHCLDFVDAASTLSCLKGKEWKSPSGLNTEFIKQNDVKTKVFQALVDAIFFLILHLQGKH